MTPTATEISIIFCALVRLNRAVGGEQSMRWCSILEATNKWCAICSHPP